MKRYMILVAFIALLCLCGDALARAGCCSRHGGVCGCECCDGTALSAKCAPYYPSCSETKSQNQVVPAKSMPPQKELAYPYVIEAKAVSIADGDTITVLVNDRQYKVRLNGIDCPEKSQAFGSKAKDFTANLVGNTQVMVTIFGKDAYGRYLGEVWLGSKSLNQELVRAGLAWWYRKYAPDNADLARLEDEARKGKIGLWSDPAPVAPWDFRRKSQ